MPPGPGAAATPGPRPPAANRSGTARASRRAPTRVARAGRRPRLAQPLGRAAHPGPAQLSCTAPGPVGAQLRLGGLLTLPDAPPTVQFRSDDRQTPGCGVGCRRAHPIRLGLCRGVPVPILREPTLGSFRRSALSAVASPECCGGRGRATWGACRCRPGCQREVPRGSMWVSEESMRRPRDYYTQRCYSLWEWLFSAVVTWPVADPSCLTARGLNGLIVQ